MAAADLFLSCCKTDFLHRTMSLDLFTAAYLSVAAIEAILDRVPLLLGYLILVRGVLQSPTGGRGKRTEINSCCNGNPHTKVECSVSV